MEDARRHYRRFARTEQEIVWAAIQALDIADRLVILRELATDAWTRGAKRRNEYDKVPAAINSLRFAADILGKAPSQREYRRLADESSELGLVPESSIRRWLGGTWNDCLRRALL
jgi:hypothetical protein